MTPIQFDWDYCHTCGLSAEEISQGLAAEAESGAASLDAPAAPDADLPPSVAAFDDEMLADVSAQGSFDAFTGDDDEEIGGGSRPPYEPPAPPPSAPSQWEAPIGPAVAAAGAFGAVVGEPGQPSPTPGGSAPPFGGAPSGGPGEPGPSVGPIPPGADAMPGGGHVAPPPAASKPSGMTLMGDPLGSTGGSGPPPMPMSGPILGGSVPKGAIIGGIAMFVLLIVVVVAFGGSKRETAQTSTGPTRPPLGAVALDKSEGTLPSATEVKKYAEGDGGWIVFKPDDGSFAVELPRAPDDLRLLNVALSTGDTQAITITSTTVGGGYFIAVVEVVDGDPQDVLKDVASAYAKSVDSIVKGGSPSTHYGNPSRDFVIDSRDFQANARVVKVGTKVYVLAAGGTDPTALYWEHLRDTFQPTPA